MENAKQQLLERLKTANNILVTVSRDPSVDQLAALLGLTLMLNKQGKHAAAVFSGEVPSTLEFLQPEQTIETNTDSLRDFIIALDKAKADKLRYKVENDVVRIFITPYKASISESDFDFSQGDFNIDLVIALGVKTQEDIDEAIIAHGRILHDATVASINLADAGNLGSINLSDASASSLSEVITSLAADLEGLSLDEQISNALLTGIVAQTERFSNDKTSAQTMSVAAILMAAGANQQLVASKLDTARVSDDGQAHDMSQDESSDNSNQSKNDTSAEDDTSDQSQDKEDDGSLAIEHDEQPADEAEDKPSDEVSDQQESGETTDNADEPAFELPKSDEKQPVDDSSANEEVDESKPEISDGGNQIMTEPPVLGGTLTANTHDEPLEPTSDPLSMIEEEKPELFDHKESTLPVMSEAAEDIEQPAEPAKDIPDAADNTPTYDAPTEQPPAGPAPEVTAPMPAWTPPTAPVADDIPATPQPTNNADNSVAPILSDLEDSVAATDNNSPASDDQPVASPAADSDVEGDLDAARDEVMRAINASSDTGAAQAPIESLNAQPIDLNPPAPIDNTHPAPTPYPQADQSAPVAQVNDPTAPPPVPPPIPFQFGQPPSK